MRSAEVMTMLKAVRVFRFEGRLVSKSCLHYDVHLLSSSFSCTLSLFSSFSFFLVCRYFHLVDALKGVRVSAMKASSPATSRETLHRSVLSKRQEKPERGRRREEKAEGEGKSREGTVALRIDVLKHGNIFHLRRTLACIDRSNPKGKKRDR